MQMMTSQLNLFNRPTLNVLRDVKGQMATAAKDSGLSRDELCDRMNELAEKYGVCLVGGRGCTLSLSTLDKWLNPEEKGHFPSIKALPIFCAAVNSVEPMRAMIEPLGWQIIGDQDVRLLTWAKQYQRARDARKQMKRLEQDI